MIALSIFFSWLLLENVSVTKKDETELVWNHFELNFVLNYMYIMLHIVCKKLVLLTFHKIVMPVNALGNNVIILQLCQVTVKEEEGNNNSVTFQRLQTMLLEEFGMHGFHYEVLISVTLELKNHKKLRWQISQPLIPLSCISWVLEPIKSKLNLPFSQHKPDFQHSTNNNSQLALRLSKHHSPHMTTVLLRTSLTLTIRQRHQNEIALLYCFTSKSDQ